MQHQCVRTRGVTVCVTGTRTFKTNPGNSAENISFRISISEQESNGTGYTNFNAHLNNALKKRVTRPYKFERAMCQVAITTAHKHGNSVI